MPTPFTLTLSLFAALTLLSAQVKAAEASTASTASTSQPAAQIAPLPAQNLYAAAPPAPEPSHGMLLMSGLIGFALRRRRS